MFKKTADLAEDGSPKLILVISPDNTLLDEIKNTQTDITVLNYEDILSSATIALNDAEAVIKEAHETTRLLKQFNEIKNLCDRDVDNSNQLLTSVSSRDEPSPTDAVRKPIHIYICILTRFQVDMGYGTMPIDVLKTLIGRLENEENPINVIPVGEVK